MNAQEAKECTYKVRPPVQPPVVFYDAIAKAASDGRRSITPPCDLTEEMRWWLEDEGFWFTTVDPLTGMGMETIISIHW